LPGQLSIGDGHRFLDCGTALSVAIEPGCGSPDIGETSAPIIRSPDIGAYAT
jgi:hypothetical protein